MNKNIYENLKDIYSPTPTSFTERVDRTLAALPKNGTRWRMPVLAVAAYALVTCGVLGLMFGLAVKPVAVPRMTAATNPAESPKDSPQPSAQHSAQPAHTPLPQLPISHPQIISAAGWQIVAVSGSITWYWRSKLSQVARVESGKCDAYALNLAAGQTVDVYSFIAADGGGGVAFTVHSEGGDSVWIVTADGRKMVVPDEVSWVDAADQQKPLKFDFSGLTMLPVNIEVNLGTATGRQGSTTTYSISSIEVGALSQDGGTYEMQIISGNNINMQTYNTGCWTGYVIQGPQLKLPDESAVAASIYGYPLKVGKDAAGSYFIGSENHKIDLQSNRFAFFRSHRNIRIVGEFIIQYALFVYENDTTQTLWMADFDTGKVEKIASGCVSAGWLENGDYWFATDSDKVKLLTGKVKYDKPVEITASIGSVFASDDDAGPTLVLEIELTIQNHTDKELIVPEDIQYSLQITRDGVPIWPQKEDLLKQQPQMYCTSMFDDGLYIDSADGQYKIPPGYVLNVSFDDIPIDSGGTYALKGTFYNGTQINCVQTLTDLSTVPLPSSIAIDAGINPGGRLSFTVANSGINGIRIPLVYGANIGAMFPPTVAYRLLSGNNVIKSGTIGMSSKAQTPEDVTVPAGGRLTFVDPSDAPPFDNLPAGDYHLECFLMYDKGYDKVPWGYAPGLYFDTTFTVPAN